MLLYDHAIAMYVPVINMPSKYHTYAKCADFLMCIDRGSMPIYRSHINLLPSMVNNNDDDTF